MLHVASDVCAALGPGGGGGDGRGAASGADDANREGRGRVKDAVPRHPPHCDTSFIDVASNIYRMTWPAISTLPYEAEDALHQLFARLEADKQSIRTMEPAAAVTAPLYPHQKAGDGQT